MVKILLFILFFHVTYASASGTKKILGRIQHDQNGLTFIRTPDGKSVPSVLETDSLKEIVKTLNSGDEVLVEGQLSFLTSSFEGETRLEPIFIISSLRPISLSRLGNIGSADVNERLFIPPIEIVYSPLSIPVSTEIASTLTMTTSILLMQSLTMEGQPDTYRDINAGLILFSGALATGLIIYEQFFETPYKGKRND